MKKLLKVVFWIFIAIIALELIWFVGNFIRNNVILNKIYSAKEKVELLNNYKLDHEIVTKGTNIDDNNVSENEKKTYRYVVKDGHTRINEYSFNGAALEPYTVKSSTLKYDDLEDVKEVLNKMVIDENVIPKKQLIKEFLFKAIKKEDNIYSIYVCTDVKDGIEYYTHLWIDKETGYITSKNTYETEVSTSELKEVKNSVREYFRIKTDIVTDEFLSNVDQDFEAF